MPARTPGAFHPAHARWGNDAARSTRTSATRRRGARTCPRRRARGAAARRLCPSLASGLLSVAVESFAQKHPTAHVELFDRSTKELVAGLENDTLDVALTVGPEREVRGLKWTPLVRASWRLTVNRTHPLSRRSRVTPAEVAAGPLLVFCQRDYPEYWEIITGWLRDHRQRLALTGEYDGVNSLLAAVESGLGVAIVTTSSAYLVPEYLQLKSLSDAPMPLCIAVGFRAHRATEKPLKLPRISPQSVFEVCKCYSVSARGSTIQSCFSPPRKISVKMSAVSLSARASCLINGLVHLAAVSGKRGRHRDDVGFARSKCATGTA